MNYTARPPFTFRAWNVDSKKYFYFSFLDPESMQQFFQNHGLFENGVWKIEQATGKFDKDNTLIYQGDICLYYKANTYANGKDPLEVRWHEEEAGFRYWNYTNENWEGFTKQKMYTVGNNKSGAWCKVIGNINENPELLVQ